MRQRLQRADRTAHRPAIDLPEARPLAARLQAVADPVAAQAVADPAVAVAPAAARAQVSNTSWS